jgi:hypothetical protein
MKPSYLKTVVGKASPKDTGDHVGEREGRTVYLTWDLMPRRVCLHEFSSVFLGMKSWEEPCMVSSGKLKMTC